MEKVRETPDYQSRYLVTKHYLGGRPTIAYPYGRLYKLKQKDTQQIRVVFLRLGNDADNKEEIILDQKFDLSDR